MNESGKSMLAAILLIVTALSLLCSSDRFVSALNTASAPRRLSSSAATFTITQPGRATISGNCRLAVSYSPRSIASVEYLLGSRRLGIALKPPFELAWSTAYGADGSSEVQAIARDSVGNSVASATRIFTVNNYGNFISTAGGDDLAETLRGVVTLTMSGSDSRYYPADFLGYIDGELLAIAWTDNSGKHSETVTLKLDTARFANGHHELYVAMHCDYWPGGHIGDKSFYSWRGAFERVVNIDNGHTQMDIAANYLHVYLKPGERTELTCRKLFTDGSSAACVAPVYLSSDPTVARVSETGVVTAGPRPGFATITLAEGARTTAVRVWIKATPGVPHFSGSGRMLDAYRPGASLFIVSPFGLQPSDLRTNPTLLAEVKLAGVNTLSRGFYSNPRNVRSDFQAWRRGFDASTTSDWIFARDEGLHIFATGDEVARNIGGEAWWTLNWPWGKAAVQYAAQILAKSGVAIAIDMVDEASMMWGSTPRPPGKVGAPGSFTSIICSGMHCTVAWPHNPVTPRRFPSGVNFTLAHSLNRNLNTPQDSMFTATKIRSDSFQFVPSAPVYGEFNAANDPGLEFVWWAGNIGGCPTHPCIPPVPNSALIDISNWIETARPTVPISWPVLGIAPPSVAGNWMGHNGISEYASHYWDSFNFRRTYPYSGGIQEMNYWMCQVFYDRQPMMALDRPQVMLGGISSIMYTKRTHVGAYFTPPVDELASPGVDGPLVTSEIMTAAALGAAGVRLYQFEAPSGLANRVKARVGSTLQTGSNPVASDPFVRENWQAMAFAAIPLTRTLTPYSLGKALTSPAYGRNIVSAVRQGPDARLLMVVNDNDWPRAVTLDFKPYRSGRAISRYRIGYDGIETDVIPDALGQTLTLGAGEAMVYLFPNIGKQFGSAVNLAPPSRSDRAVLHYGYLYKESLPHHLPGIECTRGCTLRVDLGLGPVYYQFDYLDSSGGIANRSSVTLLRANP